MRSELAMLLVLLSATLAMGQVSASKPAAPAQGAPTGTAAGAPAGPHPLQPKTQQEFEAYNLAASKTDPAQAEAAADDFAQKFPASEIKELLYVRAMNLYQQQNNSAKV